MPTGQSKRTFDGSTKSKILQASLHLFSQRGFEGASLRDIADLIDVRHGVIRYHFESKTKLWEASVEFLFTRLDHHIGDALREFTDDSSREYFEAFLRAYVAYCAAHPEHAQLMVKEATNDTSRLRWMASKFVRRNHKRFVALVETGIEGGWIKDVDPLSFGLMLTAACQAPFLLEKELSHVEGIDTRKQPWVARYADTVLQVFLQ